MTDGEAAGCARETAVSEQRHRVAEAGADDRRGHREHLAHPRTAGRSLVADDHHVARLDGLLLDRLEGLLLAVEHPRGAPMLRALGARQLEHAAFRREIAEQDDQAAVRLDRSIDRPDHFLSRSFDGLRGFLSQRPAADGRDVAVDRTQLHQPANDQRRAAGGMQFGGDEAARWFQVGNQRRRGR